MKLNISLVKTHIENYREGLALNRHFSNETGIPFLDSRNQTPTRIGMFQKAQIKRALLDRNNDPRFFENKTIVYLDKNPKVLKFENGFSIQHGTQFKIQHTSDTDVFGGVTVGVESDYFVLDNNDVVIGFIDGSRQENAICQLLVPVSKQEDKGSQIENILLLNNEFVFDLKTGSIEFGQNQNLSFLQEEEKLALSKYLSQISQASQNSQNRQAEEDQPGNN